MFRTVPGQRRTPSLVRRSRLVGGVSLALLAALLAGVGPAAAAKVKATGDATLAAGPKTSMPNLPAGDHMVVEADQVVYDDKADTVTALGAVTIYYRGTVLTARKVTYVRTSQRVIAEGDARLVDKDGNVLTSPKMDVTQGFSEGFVESLRIDTIDRSRFAAERASRTGGNTTVFEKGVYSACQTCVNEPGKPPFWQIKAAKIVHDQKEKTVYYEDARLEMLGTPIAWVPFFEHPDPSERRKTGFLMPRVINSNSLGLGVQVPFYWAPVADWDATLSPVAMSRQGVLADVEVRHRIDSGLITGRGWGISQLQPEAFRATSGNRSTRGAFNTTGTFTLGDQWSWGWDVTAVSDRRFLDQYHLVSSNDDRTISTVFLKGESLKSYFEAHAYRFTVFTDDVGFDRAGNQLLFGAGTSLQDKQPLVAPVIDWDRVAEDSYLGGEVSGHANLTSLTRSTSDIDTEGRVYAIAGTFSRVSGMVQWRRQFVDSLGQVFTPSASLRGDVFYNQSRDETLVGFVQDGTFGRVTPTLALDYAYPFVMDTSIGAHTFSPMAQLVVRPSEQWVGRLPNEDAQSVVFDDTTLFRTDKFSGWDRAEGGTRLNLGGRYSFHGPAGGSISALFGRSYLLSGVNSFAYPGYSELMNLAALGRPVPLTAFGSGLETNASDWVGGVAVDSAMGFRIGAQARFGSQDFRLERSDIQASGTSGPVSASVTWAYKRTPQQLYDLLTEYATNPLYGASAIAIRDTLKSARSELQTATNLRLTPTWRLFGGIRYDLVDRSVTGSNAGVGYDNDSFSISLSYAESTYWSVDAGTAKQIHDQTVFLRFGLRTLGDGSLSNSLASSN
ncbi:MAG: LPS-assembly protein LptD [Phyllobacteriaceae bacterium]|nr:LPS-assembly protein LptD [Phyllobacteriaceae bacterium]